jgi:hypothetical protein
MHDETLPEDGFKDAHPVRCGPKFRSMNISAKVEAFTAEDAEAVLRNGAGAAPGECFRQRLISSAAAAAAVRIDG